MTRFDRRRYLQALAGSSALALGVGGAAMAGADPGNGNGNGGGGGPGQAKNECQPPNALLAKYEWVEGATSEYEGCDGAFVLEEGDGSLVWITDVECDEEGEPVAVEWASSVPVCDGTVKAGQEIVSFSGGIRSGTADNGDVKFAISNVVFCERPAQAILCDAPYGFDGDYAFECHTHLDGTGGRDDAVHVTSHGDPTRDYASGTVNVAREGLTVGDFPAETLTYDYLVGGANTNAVPDEVFLVLETPDQAGDNADPSTGDRFDVAYRTRRENSTAAVGSWLTRDVVADMQNPFTTGDVHHRWHASEVTESGLLDTTTPGGVVTTAAGLRDSPERTFTDLLGAYDGETRILGVGFGYGYTTEAAVLDAAFDDLVAGGTYSFPAAVPMDAAVTKSGSTVTATLAFEQSENVVGVDDVVPGSVALNDFWRFAPPTAPGVPAASVAADPGAGTITATFDVGSSPLSGLSAGDVVTVTGDFDNMPQVISFVGTGEIEP